MNAFTDPAAADDELRLAEQLLTGLDLRIMTFTTRITALARNVGRVSGDFAYSMDIAHFMAGRPLPQPSPARRLDTANAVSDRWHTLVTVRRYHLTTGSLCG
ncbi:hypothetical protein ACWDUC_02720 [Streptomyces tricolor]